MFGTLGGPEVILILVVALIVFGPRRLPEIGKSMGKMLAEFRKASNDFKRTIDEELEAEKSRESQAATPAPESPAPAASVSATDPVAPVAPEATPEVAAPPAPTFAGADASGTPESEPRLDRPAEPIVSRGGPADKS